jgi:glycerol kinase
MVFDREGREVSSAQAEFRQIFPASGLVEHDPEEIWATTLSTARTALRQAEAKGGRVAAIGIANQRETVVVWDRATGAPVGNALVWQDRRTAPACRALAEAGHEADISARTGLLLDPYFSATKLAWILDEVPDARAQAEAGSLAFGTVDSWLLARLTGLKVHATDATNASRTMLFNIRDGAWDETLLGLFRVPRAMLPEVHPSAHVYGETDPALFGRAIPICGIAGDQQAASFGQACTRPGDVKCTFGTGAFALAQTGPEPVASRNRLLTTLSASAAGAPDYAIEGSVFVAGAAVQWLRDGLGVLRKAEDAESLAASRAGNDGLYLVPAFTGLGAPHWDAEARGALFGITRATDAASLARAALESVAYQTRDLMDAMRADGVPIETLKVDGGMTRNAWFLQFLADILALPVERPMVSETTALGAALLAGLGSGLFGDREEAVSVWRADREFEPKMAPGERDRLIAGWADAVRRTLTH